MDYISEMENQINVLKDLQAESRTHGNAIMVDQLALTIGRLCMDVSYLKKEAVRTEAMKEETEAIKELKNLRAGL